MSGGIVDVQVQGAEDIARLARRMKEVGNRDLRNEMVRGLRAVAKPVIKDMKQSARSNLPASGGLNRFIAGSSIRAQVKSGTHTAGVAIKANRSKKSGASDLNRIDQGRLRHPVFGRGRWVTQSVKAGVFSKPTERSAAEVQRQMQHVLQAIERKLE